MIEVHKTRVISVLKAISYQDLTLLMLSVKGEDPHGRPIWSKDEHDLLLKWLSEAISGCWQIFSDDETFGLSKNRVFLKKMLFQLSRTAGSTPKLAVISALAPLLERK